MRKPFARISIVLVLLAVVFCSIAAGAYAAEGPPTSSEPSTKDEKAGVTKSGAGVDADDEGLLGDIKDFFGDVGEGIKNGAEAVGEGIKNGAEAVGEGIKNGAEAVGEVIKNAWDVVKTWPDQRWFQVTVGIVLGVGLIVGSIFAGPIVAAIMVGAGIGFLGSMISQLGSPPGEFSWLSFFAEGALGGLAGGVGAWATGVLKAGMAAGKFMPGMYRFTANFTGQWIGQEMLALIKYWDKPDQFAKAQGAIVISSLAAGVFANLKSSYDYAKLQKAAGDLATKPGVATPTVKQVAARLLRGDKGSAPATDFEVAGNAVDRVADLIEDGVSSKLESGFDHLVDGEDL